MADIIGLAQEFYDSALDESGEVDSAVVTTLTTHRNTLRDAIAAGTTTGTVVTASKNGVSYTSRVDIGVMDRLKALSYAIICLANNTRPSRRTIARL